MPVKDLTVSGSPDLKPDFEEKKFQENGPASSLVRPQKVGFVSLGCPKNLVDSEVMMGLLARAGAELTRRAEDADVIVVNTCSFIESAQQESINTILDCGPVCSRDHSRGVGGCPGREERDRRRHWPHLCQRPGHQGRDVF